MYKIGDNVTAQRPTCSCKNARMETLTGKIVKVVNSANTNQVWYLLDSNKTIKHEWITQVN